MLIERMQQVKERIKEVMADAERRYGVDLSVVKVRFDLRGRCAGIAGYKGTMFGEREYFLRFNRDMIGNDGFKHLIEDTVPHEIAHVVCYMRPELGRNHNPGWKRVCQTLGGTGERCHKEQVVYAKGLTFQYKTTVGRLITVSEKIHKKIQMGMTYTVKRGGGKLLKTCEWVRFQPGVVQLAEGPAAPKAAPKAKETAPKAVAPKAGTKAEQVREFIRDAKRQGKSQDAVVARVVLELAMDKGQARRYVQNNWDRA